MASHSNDRQIMAEDIVISGMSGRFPESDTTDEFATNLYNNVDMITNDNRRWPTELYDMNSRMGKIKEVDKFDGNYFGIMNSLADPVDPQSRILLETTFEAIIDAGMSPQSLRGTQTGVYIGFSTFGMPDGIPEETQPDLQNSLTDALLWVPGHSKCLYANRISFVFDFKGPSLITDTACSSSLVAMDLAMNDLRLGKCDQAIVGGTQINLQPFTNHIFQATRLISADGIPKVWDQSADGFTRGETIACVLLQKKSEAKRIYATVLNSGVNIDGYKRMGMFFPSSESQENLMVKVYTDAKVDPLKVNYFEAHATGTKAGDPQEARAIYNAFCARPKREGTLAIGLLKSNIGHAEGASGMSSLVKVLLAYENECIPANKHLKELKSTIAELCPPLVSVSKNMKYIPGISGINNFGVGGVNAHVLLEPNYKVVDESALVIADAIPRLVNICCRTEEALNSMFKFIETNPDKITRDFLALLTDTMKYNAVLNSGGFPYRGTIFIKQLKSDTNQLEYEYKKQFSIFREKSVRPLYFLFPGLGGQWSGMAKALMPIKIFADKIEEYHEVLKEFGVDLKHILLSDDDQSMSTMTNKFCATTALQLALFDVIDALKLVPNGIIGHSFGEIACAYADGCLTAREALIITYIRGHVTQSDRKIPKGLMAVVGLSWAETKKLCPKGVSVVCNNAKDTVVISGIYSETQSMIDLLNKKGVFVRALESNEIPFHSEYLMTCAKQMTDEIKKYIPKPILRSKKWISTAVLESDPKEELLYASAEYFVQNLISPVYFHNKINCIPEDAIVVEIGPHGLFAKIVTQSLESSTYLSLIKRDQNETNLDTFLTSIAKLYEMGLNPAIENLYPKVEWPVARNTQSISSLMHWDHTISCYVRKYPDFCFRTSASDMNKAVNLSRSFEQFLVDHTIDGHILFPATGFLMLAWRQLAAYKGRIWNQVPVVFEDVQFRRAVFLKEDDTTVRLKAKYHEQTGDFVITESGNVCCLGKIRCMDEGSLCVQHWLLDMKEKCTENDITIETESIYKDLRTMGYDYGPQFRKLKNVRTNDFESISGDVEWDGNWITFLDSLCQSMAVALPFRKMIVPVMIKSLKCDPKVLFDALVKNKVSNEVQDFDEDRLLEEVVDIRNEDIEESAEYYKEKSQELMDKYLGQRFHIYKSVLPFYVDLNLKMLVTYGVEVEDIICLPLPRKSNVKDLKLESYEFMANEDNSAVDEDDSTYLIDYIKVCSTLATQLKQTLGLNDTKHDFNNNQSKELIEKYLKHKKDDEILLKIYDKLIQSSTDPNQNLDKDLAKESINQLKLEFKTNPDFDLSKDVINHISKNQHLVRSLVDIVSENNVPKKEIRVLEINLSAGLMALEVDMHLASAALYPIDVNYSLVVKAVDAVHEDYKKKSFKLSEWDPKQTVFPDDITSKDLIILRDTPDLWDLKLDDHLQQVYDCIVEKGFFLAVFKTQFTEPELALAQILGIKAPNKEELEQRVTDFAAQAKVLGFSLISRKYDSIGSMALLFRKVYATNIKIPNNKKQVIEINSDYHKWFEVLKQRVIENRKKDDRDNIWLIGNQTSVNGIIGLINCLRLEPGGESIRCLFDFDNIIKLPVNFAEKPFSDLLCNDLAVNVLKNGKLGTYRHLTLHPNFDKCPSNEYYLNVTANRDLSSLQWFDSRNLVSKLGESYNITNEPINQVRCNVYSSGLNFRDVMFATGRIAAGPQSLFFDCQIGFEFAGRRADTGQRVCGFSINRCFATNVDTNEEHISPVPDNWSMEDAVTILSTYSTVWYGLIKRANLCEGEKILIHSGAGGVGQAAISICQHYKCDIFVTVGTEEKKQFLMSEYGIPENRLFNSRDIQFKYSIKQLTKGKGVNLVLNSLTGDKLDASYECIADCGRFVEIGKYDLQMNKQLGMFSFLRDVSFIGVSVDLKLYLENGFTEQWFDWMHKNSNNGCIRPINRTVFRAPEVEKAFRYMTTGKHIGKIVIRIRDEEQPIAPVVSTPKSALKLSTIAKTYFNPHKVYIITGGLGGMGIELLHWMISLGARNFVLTSRYGLKTDYQKFIIRRLECLGNRLKIFGTKVVISTHDSNTIAGAKQLVEEAQKLGTIGGIFHLALVLNDSLFENLTIDKFCETIDSKTKSFENLDLLSRNMSLDLDYFVVFSSVSCGKGNSGQTNYGFANSICERICEMRRSDGLKALAIQWGPIGDVGVIADSERFSTFSGVVKQRINFCFETLDKLLQIKQSIVSCVVRAKRQVQGGTREAKIVAQIWLALGIDPSTTPDHLTLGEIGMESMFAVEFQQGLERDYDIKLSINDIKNITIRNMKEFEAGKIEVFRQLAKEIREARDKLSKIKFIIPTETHTRLNNVNTGTPVYFLPPLEGIFASLESLAEQINRPVIGLNWTKEMEGMSSMKDITEYYINLMQTLVPNGNYDIVGHFYGALIAMKMLSKKAPIGKSVIIDMMSGTQMSDEMLSDEYLLELITKFISKDLPKVVRDKLLRDMKNTGDVNMKLSKLSAEIKEFVGKSLVSKHLDDILRDSFNRAKLFTGYRLRMKKKLKQKKISIGKKLLEMKGKLLIIKPHELTPDNNTPIDISERIDRIKDSYFLPEKGLEGKLNFQTINDDSDNVVFNKIALSINEFLVK